MLVKSMDTIPTVVRKAGFDSRAVLALDAVNTYEQRAERGKDHQPHFVLSALHRA